MKSKITKLKVLCILFLVIVTPLNSLKADDPTEIHVWEMKEIKLKAEKS